MDLNETAVFTARLEERITCLRELIDEREKYFLAIVASIRAAAAKAEDGQDKLNQKANEFRAALDDAAKLAANTQATKSELQTLERLVNTHATQNELDLIVLRVAACESRMSSGDGRAAGVGSSQDFIFKALPIFIALAAVAVAVWKH